MGWYLRKSFSIGPIRLNLSRSGLGASVGVRGARIGVGPKGSYIHAGTGGLYYRQSLGSLGRHNDSNNSPILDTPAVVTSDGFQKIDSSDVSKLTDSSSESVLKELSRVQKHTDFFPLVLGLAFVCFVCMFFLKVPSWSNYVFFMVLIPFLVFLRHLDVTKGTAILQYDLEANVQNKFKRVVDAFSALLACSRVWHIEASGYTDDGKRNSGVNTILQRRQITPHLSTPPRVQSNIKVPTLNTGQQTLYFFPDRILVYASDGVGAVSYQDLSVEVSNTRFVENDAVPQDAKMVGTTWKYVNKNGGPDRRFNNNREIPILQYERIHLKSSNGLNALFMLSRLNVAADFTNSVNDMRAKSWDMHLGV